MEGKRSSPRVAPYRQGELDGLCGLYSALNGLRFVLTDSRPLTARECAVLFRVGVEFLESKGALAAAVYEGMPTVLWRGLIRHLCREASTITGLHIESRKLFATAPKPTIRVFHDKIRTTIDAGSPVLLLLGGTYEHFTVIVACSTTQLLLVDSLNYRRVSSLIDWLRQGEEIPRVSKR